MADSLDINAGQQLWGERALATSRNQQTAFKEQWELIIESGKSQSIVLAELRKRLESLQREVVAQQDELRGCTSSVSRLDRLVTQHTQQKMEEVRADIEGSFSLMEQKHKSEVQMLESHLMIIVENKFKQQQDLLNAQSHEQDSLSGSDMWVGIKKEQYSHEVYIQDMLRRFGVSVKEQDTHFNHIQGDLERLDEQLRWLVKEHDTGVVKGKEELQHFCTAIKAGLDARVTYLHEKVGELEKSLEAQMERVQAGRRDADIIGQIAIIHDELGRLSMAVPAEQKAREVSIQEGLSRLDEELERQARSMKGELQKLNVSMAARDGADTRLQSVEERLEAHVHWAEAEIRQVNAQFEVNRLKTELETQTARLDKELRGLRTAIESECDARCAGLRESVTHFQEELDKHSQWIQGEVCKIEATAKEQNLADARQNDRCERDLQAHISWVCNELQLLDNAVKTDHNTRLQRLEAAHVEETTVRASQREAHFEAELCTLRQGVHNVDAMVKEHSVVEANTCDRVAMLEGQLHEHAAWARGELRQLDTSLKSDHGVRLCRVEDQLDTHMGWVEGELRQLDAASRIERQRFEDQLVAHVERTERELSDARAKAEAHRLEQVSGAREMAARLDRELDTQQGRAVQAELRRLSTEVAGYRQARAGAEAIIHAEVRRLESKLGEELTARTVESNEAMQQRGRHVEARIGELEGCISQLEDGLRAHWHSMSVMETIRCGPAEPSRRQGAAMRIQSCGPVAREPVARQLVARAAVACEPVPHGSNMVSTPQLLTRSPPEPWSPERTWSQQSRTTTDGTPARTSVALFQNSSLQQSSQVNRSSAHPLQASTHDPQSLLQT